MIATNSLFIAFGIGKFLYFNETVFKDFSRKIPQLPSVAYWTIVIVPGILTLTLYIGMFWAVRVLHEKRWIKSGFIFFFAGRVLAVLIIPLSVLLHRPTGNPYYNMIGVGQFLQILTTAYMLVTFLFVKHPAIRIYFRCFALLTIVFDLAVYFGPGLYDDFGYNWLLVNKDAVFYVPFISSLILFVELYNLSRQQNILQ